MGGRGGGGGGGVSNASAGVPASSRKVVESLKEIVNCSELEIYAMLVDCDMDPDETVSRLLSQDTFHEVKSKRDKKKETKDPAESWTRGRPNRGARSSGNDGYNNTRGGGNRFKSNETGSVQSVPANRRENGTRNHWAGSSSTPGVLGRQPPPNNDPPTNAEVKKAQPTASSDAVTSSPLPTPAYQSAWVNANPGQRTMADIVKMGLPLHQKNVAVPRSAETTQESGSKAPLKDEWPSIEKQDVSYPTSSLLKPAGESKASTDQFSQPQTHLDEEVPETKTNPVASPLDEEQIPPASVSNRNLLDDNDDDARDSALYEDENNKAELHAFEGNRGEDVSASVAAGFQQLTIENEEDHETLPKDKPPVIIPSHLQVHTSECSHLMFGSFGSVQATSGLNDNLEETKETEDNSSFRHPEADFYGEEEEEQLRNAATDEQISYPIDSTARDYHASSDSETEAEQHERLPPQEDHQYKFSSPADYGFENSQQLNPPSETSPQIQSLDTFPNVMQQGIQDAREPDLHYSPFPTKYNNATPSSLSGPSISMAEALRAASISPQNAMPSAGEQAAALAQHLAVNPYSHQPGMSLGPYGNLISYPFMPQSYNPYMPTAFQQAFPAGNHHQSMLPQYKTQASAPPVPPPSAYGFGGGSALSNNFSLNPTSAPNSYEDVLSSQFRDSNHLASSLQQQNEHLAAWHQGQQSNSRVVPGSGYYSLPGHQNQQPPGFRQAQLASQQQQQHFGGHGYGSPYHSQAPMSLDHLHHQHQQQQNARDASKQTHQQSWPHNY